MASSSGTNGRNETRDDLSGELWQVQHGSGPVRTMTLDELDAAFKRDEITTRTLVRKVGAFRWQTLGDVAGIESSPTLESESLMPVTSEIDVTAPKIPKAPAMPRLDASAMESGGFEPVESADLIKDEDDAADTLKLPSLHMPTRVAGRGGTFEDAGETQPSVRRASTRKRVLGLAAVALAGVAVFAGVSTWLMDEYGAPGSTATAALVAPVTTPEAPPAPVEEPAAEPTILAEGSVLVLKPADGERESAEQAPEPAAEPVAPPAAKAPAARAAAPAKRPAAPAKRPPMIRHAPAKKAPSFHASAHGSFKAGAKGSGVKAAAPRTGASKAKTR